MSFQNQAFWLATNAGCLNDRDVTTSDNSSRIGSKRASQWFMDSPQVDLFPNKKQAVEVSNNDFLTGMPSSGISSWGNSSCFQSFTAHFTEQLYDPDAATTTMNFENRNIPSVGVDKLNVERKGKMEPFGIDSSFGLSSAALKDPQSGFNYGGVRKVKVSEVKESESVISVHTNHPYERVVNTLSDPHAYNGGDTSMSTSVTYNKGDGNIVLMGNAYGKTNNNFISMGQSYNMGDDNVSIGQSYKEVYDTISIGQGFSKMDSNVASIAQACIKANENSMSGDCIFSKGEDGTISVDRAYYSRGKSMPLVSHSSNRGQSTIISFGGCDEDDTTCSGRFISSYELLIGQALSHNSGAMNEKQLLKSNPNSLISAVLTSASTVETVSKIKDEVKMSKKATSNNFPSNVRSLLSTGMLDGIPVKYKAWSREKELRGVIKGSGYLCSCQSCNYSKLINAYEFERHAGCKTKHPNNHIYFENGKTIYGIVQELRSTPQIMLFEVIQTITGSPINQKSFHIWKDSFLAATQELQRIYGKDDVK